MQTDINDFLGGNVRLYQYKNGYRVTSDAVLVASAVRARSGETVLDVGMGTGAILYCLGARVPDLQLTGIEYQADLCLLACQNQELNHQTVRIIEEDVFADPSSLCGEQFHHVVSNPPYYTEPFVRAHEQTAKAYHQSVDLSRWIRFCVKHVRAKGTFTLIHRTEALPEILATLNETALGAIEVFPIQSKVGRDASRVIVRGILGAKTPFVLHEPLIMHTEDDQRSAVADSILRNGVAIK